MKYTRRKRFVELENINEKEISMKKDLFEGTEQTQKVVAKATKHKVLKKALVTLGLISAIGACVFLTACNKKDNNKTTNGITPPTTQQGEQTGGNQGGQTGGNQGGQTGGEQTGGNQGGETGGETNPEKPADKTPAEYKAECEQKIVDALEVEIAKTAGINRTAEITDYKFNLNDGSFYVNAAIYRKGRFSDNCFYHVKSNLGNLQNVSYKELTTKLDNIQFDNCSKYTIMDASELGDKYNALCNYVLGEYDLQDGEILNVTNFKSDGSGYQKSITTVLYNGEIFTVSAKTTAPNNDNSTVIDCLLGNEYLGQSVTITSRSAFKDFDNIVSAEAGISSYKVKLGGKTLFSKTNGNIVYNNDFGMGM